MIHLLGIALGAACRSGSTRRGLVGGALLCALWPAGAQAAETIRFATGPFRPTVEATRTEFEPLFHFVANNAGVEPEIVVFKDWPSLGTAMERGEVDVAWMGGAMRYVQAAAKGGGAAIATVTYQGVPTVRSIIVARPGLDTPDFPRGAKGLSISFTHGLSTTGWLMPVHLAEGGGDRSQGAFPLPGGRIAHRQHAPGHLG